MQDYFDQNLFSDSQNALVDLSFVVTLLMVFLNGYSPIAQVCVSRLGLRPVMITGSIFITVSLEFASLATQLRAC